MEFLIQIDSVYYEISELVSSVKFTDKLNDGCSKLEFSYISTDLVLTNGAKVRFKYNDAEIFNGIVFKVSRSDDNKITVTAYDQLRYCKAKDTIVVMNESLTSIIKRMCNYFGLSQGTIAETGYILETSVQDDKTWLDIVYTSVSDTLYYNQKKYALRDEFGLVALRNLEDLKLNLILGDESLCYGYEHEKSIDEDFYNIVKIYIKADETTDSQMVVSKSDTSIDKYGLLQYFEAVDTDTTYAKAKDKADKLLGLYNQEYETLSLDCLGDTRVRAGNSFYAYISDIGINNLLIVNQVTHSFLPIHTMSLEVSI